MEKFNTSLLNALAKVKNIKEIESFSNGQLSSESVAVNLAAVYNKLKLYTVKVEKHFLSTSIQLYFTIYGS